jgi:MarR-like DNA-binding transcriptional regulator SgrR of sgrS sRNA
MKLEILKLLEEKDEKTSQGISLVDLVNILHFSIRELKILLNELHKEKKIIVRQGINGKLIYLKK